MAEGITIRGAASTDAPALAALLGELGYAVEPNEVPRRLDQFRWRGNGQLIVALSGGGVVGFAAVEITFPIHDAHPVAHLSAFAVAQAHRRQGIGRRLLTAVEECARAAHCGRVVVTSAEHRADAHAFYVAAGWPYRGRRFGRDLA